MSTCMRVMVIAGSLASLGAPMAARAEDRTFDGTGNNVAHPAWGAANTRLVRRSPSAYMDGKSAMARPGAANPRTVSNAVVAQSVSRLNERGLSDMVWQWGQFVDHDIGITKGGSETAPVQTVPSDPTFHGSPMGFTRSQFDPGTGTTGPREQINSITSYLDGSMVYGSDATSAGLLRSYVGGGLLVQTGATGAMLPYNTMGMDMGSMPGSDPTTVFAAGDGRANEQPALTCMHTLFLREHNRQAGLLAAAHPEWSDEQVYQMARKIVGAQIQKITFSDWLPALLGPGRVGPYTGYDAGVNAGIATEFSTAAFRIGHTMVNGTILRLDAGGGSIPQGPLTLRNHFFSPSVVMNEGGISPVLRGLIAQPAQEVDVHVVDDVRELLMGPFGPPGFIGFDLAALNIQRGRDHGLCDYNSMRAAYGLPTVTTFAQVTSDPALAAMLGFVYGNVSMVDPWVGMLAEDHVAGGSAGPLLTAVLVDQFTRTRAGDRFWYQNDPALTPYLAQIGATTLGSIIRANTDIASTQEDVFFVRTSVCRVDFNHSGGVDVQDVFDFLNAWLASDARADFNGINGFEVQDIFDFLNAWFVGCP
ncbi:MAG TPA: peroxidase family protein [Phycisphaerales bacterium]|nr:peroxidase family protein [Phycisphaerales bacterium]